MSDGAWVGCDDEEMIEEGLGGIELVKKVEATDGEWVRCADEE